MAKKYVQHLPSYFQLVGPLVAPFEIPLKIVSKVAIVLFSKTQDIVIIKGTNTICGVQIVT
jgi:hypothetical protein